MLGQITEKLRTFFGGSDNNIVVPSRKRPFERCEHQDAGIPAKRIRSEIGESGSSLTVGNKLYGWLCKQKSSITESSIFKNFVRSPSKSMNKLPSSSDTSNPQMNCRSGLHPQQATHMPHVQQDMRGMPLAHSTPHIRPGYNFSGARVDIPQDFHFKRSQTEAMRPRIPLQRQNNGSLSSHRPYVSRSYPQIMHHPGDGRTIHGKTVFDKTYRQHPSRMYKHKLASKESIRLEEKQKYSLLLQQFTNEPVAIYGTSKTSRKPPPQHQKSASETVLGSEVRSIDSDVRPKVNQRVDKMSVTRRLSSSASTVKHKPPPCITDRSFVDLPGKESYASKITSRSNSEASDTPVYTSTPPAKSSQTSGSDSDSLEIIKVEKSPFSPRSATSIQFQSEYRDINEWVELLKTKCSTETRRKDRKIMEEEIKNNYFKQKREEWEEQIEKRIRNSLSLSERIPAVLEESDEEEEADEFPELSDEQEARIDYVFRGRNYDETLSTGFKLQITRRDLLTLKGLEWLNDEVINFYMNLLMERGQQDNFPSVHAFNTFFYPKLIKGGQSSVARWTRRGNVDIFSKDYVLVPVHLGMHWCLAVIDFRKQEIRYYDSMGGNNNACLNALRQYIADEHQDKKKSSYDTSGWTLINVKEIPHQMNGSDCGMFSCKFAEYITRDAKITFTQEHMPYFRRRMVLEILIKQLL